MPKRLSPEEATVMIIRRRLQQMEEAKMAEHMYAGEQTAANDDDIDLGNAGFSSIGLSGTSLPGTGLPGTGLPGTGLPGTGLPGTGLPGTGLPRAGFPSTGSPNIETQSTGKELPKD